MKIKKKFSCSFGQCRRILHAPSLRDLGIKSAVFGAGLPLFPKHDDQRSRRTNKGSS